MRKPRYLRACGLGINLAVTLTLAATATAAATSTQPPRAAAYLPVPLESPLYDDLEHFRALGLWHGSLEMRPTRRELFVRAVETIRSAAAQRRLSPRDGLRLQRMEETVRGWQGAAAASGTETSIPDAGGPPVRADLAAALHFVGTASDLASPADLDRRSRREQFILLTADIGVADHAFAHWRFYEDYDRLTPFRPGDRWADNLPPGLRDVLTSPSARNDQAVLGAAWGWGELQIGREDRHWGTGRHGTLFLSENPFPLDGVSARFDTRYVAGTSLVAQLRRGNDLVGSTAPPSDSLSRLTTGDAWMAAHRIELRPPLPLRIGLYEAVAWSGRGIDLGYANPVALLLAVNQDLFDRAGVDDKKVVGCDFEADLAPISVYGELLINRVLTLDADQGQNGDATTWAQLGGMRWADPIGFGGADLDLEYAHLDPEVYFHKDQDPGRSLLSEGELLGHWLGPNADSFRARLAAPAGLRLGTVALSFERARWGVIDGLRGTELGFFHLRKRDKRWITGKIEEERILAAEWRRDAIRLSPQLFLDAEARLARVDRSGMHTRDGWQAELRLTCRASVEVGQ